MKRLLFLPLFLIFSCTTFIKDSEVPALKEYEKNLYILKKEIKVQEKSLPAGEKVRIMVKVGQDWIRIHVHSAGGDQLKVQRILAVLLIDEDFNERVFDKAVFDKKFNEIFEPVKETKKNETKK